MIDQKGFKVMISKLGQSESVYSISSTPNGTFILRAPRRDTHRHLANEEGQARGSWNTCPRSAGCTDETHPDFSLNPTVIPLKD